MRSLETEPRSFSLCFTPESLRYGTRRSQREFRSRFSERTAFLFNENIKGRIKDKYNEITNSFPWSSTLFKKKTHPVCDAKKCKCAVAPFFFFFRKSVFHGHHTAKEHNLSETRVVRSLWPKKMLSFYVWANAASWSTKHVQGNIINTHEVL